MPSVTAGWSCGARRRVTGNVSDRGIGVRVLVSARGHMARTPDRRKVRDTSKPGSGRDTGPRVYEREWGSLGAV